MGEHLEQQPGTRGTWAALGHCGSAPAATAPLCRRPASLQPAPAPLSPPRPRGRLADPQAPQHLPGPAGPWRGRGGAGRSGPGAAGAVLRAGLAPWPPLGAGRGGDGASGVNKAGGRGWLRVSGSHGASYGPGDGGAARLSAGRRRLLLRRRRFTPRARPASPPRLLPAALRSAPRRSPLTNDVRCARRDER